MPDSFEFTIPKPSLQLGDDRTDSVVIDVTSRLGRHGLVGVEVVAGEGADAAWFGQPEPQEFDLPSGETLRSTIPVNVPVDATAGDYSFELRAYAVDNPQQDFTNSPSVAMAVPEPKAPSGIPSWILILIAVLVVLVLGLAAYFLFFRGGEDPIFPKAPDLIGLTVEEANLELEEGQSLQEFSEAGVDSSGCIVLQTPPETTPTGSISVLVVTCPTRAVNLPAPEVLENLCDKVAEFCTAVGLVFGADFAEDATWLGASGEMLQDFADTFRIDGVEVTSAIGRPAQNAIDQFETDGFLVSPISDGTAGAQCVFLQHPFSGSAALENSEIRFVTTSCPAPADTADQVVLNTPISENFDNLCDIVRSYCNSISTSDLGPDYFSTEDFTAEMDGMSTQFRNEFTGDVVPDVVGLPLADAIAAIESKGLKPKYTDPRADPSEDGMIVLTCLSVEKQNPESGLLIENLEDEIVVLRLQETLCFFFPLIPIATIPG